MLRSAFDRIVAAIGLVLLSPLLLILAVAILLEDGPPVFFRQTRVGRGGRKFRLVKFRSMRAAQAAGKRRGALITAANDPRITRLGAFLRRYKLDELPQLWNIFVGDMRLVGPRPEVPEFVNMESEEWRKVLAVPPGITDLPTLLFRDEERVLSGKGDAEQYYRDVILPQKLALSIDFLQRRGFWLDLKLILLTLYYTCFPGLFEPLRIRRSFRCLP